MFRERKFSLSFSESLKFFPCHKCFIFCAAEKIYGEHFLLFELFSLRFSLFSKSLEWIFPALESALNSMEKWWMENKQFFSSQSTIGFHAFQILIASRFNFESGQMSLAAPAVHSSQWFFFSSPTVREKRFDVDDEREWKTNQESCHVAWKIQIEFFL